MEIPFDGATAGRPEGVGPYKPAPQDGREKVLECDCPAGRAMLDGSGRAMTMTVLPT
jgi:hypothetical protein